MRPAAGRAGASPGRAGRLLAAVCVLAGVLAGGVAAGSPAVAAPAGGPAAWGAQCGAAALGLGQDSVQLAPVLKTDTLPGGGPIVARPLSGGAWVPVIMVHGWTGTDTNTPARGGAFSHYIDLSDTPGFSPDVTRSLIGQLQRIPGAAVFTFDYHPYSARWVDDPHLGPALGEVIDCLYRASGQKVIVVAHSMGGLIARYAATGPGVTGTDRSGEISSVVTFGTPETGSVAALLAAAGIDAGATVSDQLAVIRLILAACGQLASGDIATGTICDTLPAPVRAFASDAGIALRAGSPQLAALKPWPASIRLTALAGNATFELPDPGWFSLPWDTKAVDVGDLIVTPGSAHAGAATTGNATCDYQLNLVRAATDQAGVWLGLTSSSQVARQPLGSFAGACFHTNLMRGIELANDAYAAVSADITSRAQAQPGAGYYRYTNRRFMFSFDVPDGYTAGPLPEDRDGESFTNSTGTATVTAWGANNTSDWTPSQDLALLVSAHRSDGGDVTLDYLNGDVVAVSGTTASGTIFYERDIVYPAVIYALAWTYPTAEQAQYDGLVTHTVSSFTPGPDHGD